MIHRIIDWLMEEKTWENYGGLKYQMPRWRIYTENAVKVIVLLAFLWFFMYGIRSLLSVN